MQRRDFLHSLGAIASSGMLGAMPLAADAADTSGYRALVCVFLLGGNDSFNMVVPRSLADYGVYANARQNLAVSRDTLLPITPLRNDAVLYGLHPSMTGIQRLFADGRAALVAGVGPLIVPTNKAQLLARAVPIPPQLFSHNDQQEQWQTLKGLSSITTGWAGRAADALEATLLTQKLPLNISLAGVLPWQFAQRASPYAIGEQGPVPYFVLDPPVPGASARRRAFEALVATRQPTPFGRAVNRVQQRTLELATLTQQAIGRVPALSTVFPDSSLGRQLSMVARLIAARDELAMRRQIFIVAIGGFDTHDVQNIAQPGLLGGVSAGLTAFDTAMRELGVGEQVTAFTMTEFGRTLTSNGDGTDHGWAGHQWVVGGAVRGGDIYGVMPRLEIDGPDDVGGGRIVPTLAVHQYAATLLKWFGFTETELPSVVNGLSPFAQRDIGFMRS